MFAMLTLALFAAVLGAALCLVGYRFFLVMLPVWGFFGGFWLGAMGTSLLLGEGFLATATGLVLGLIVGLIGSVLSYLFYQVGVIVVAASFGGALGSGVMSALGFDPGLIMTIVTIVSGLVAIGLTLLFSLQKLVLIVYTAMAGGALIVLAAMLLFGQVTVADLQAGGSFIQPIFGGSWFWGLVWLALAGVGAAVQFRVNQTFAFRRDMYVEGWG